MATESRSGSGVRDASVRELQEEDLSSNGEETSARLEAQVEKDEDKERRRGLLSLSGREEQLRP